ncbi:MAG TPA: prolyl oligopeptidase family serine peptidase, partial [Candidatus Acidoferrales bacterium]|nr:prolyl oligopeptidase family serine peptidase [Candidatus Acidoferrales bacterium]
VNSKRELADRLPHARYSGLDFTRDAKSIYYTYQTPQGPRVFRHDLGTDAAKDPMVWGEGVGPEKIIGTSVTDDGRFLIVTLIYGASADRTDLYIASLDAPQFAVRPIVTNLDARFIGDEGGGLLYLQTNWNAPNSKVIAVDPANPQRENWKTIVPEAEVPIENMALVGGKICVAYTKNAASLLRVFGADGKLVRDVALPTLGSASTLLGRWSSDESFYIFNSFFVPPTIFRYDLKTGDQSTWWKSQAPVQSDQFTMQQVWYTSKDGTRIPMFVAHKKGLKLDGSNPAYLTAYGGFNVSLEPTFSAEAVAWMERGGVYAVPNLRGGGEFGENWHKAGMLEKKQNVFDDFFAAAEWLISNHYTTAAKLVAEGRSNGGLLMGAAMTQRPDLFRAIICGYPLLDMLRYQDFLVARYWVPEYGSSENADQFKYLYAYSPYQHVKKDAKYPGILFVSGDSDTRVAPLHARKMAALMQADAAPGRPVLLKYDTKAGHSGGEPVTKRINDITDELSFLFWQLGVTLN